MITRAGRPPLRDATVEIRDGRVTGVAPSSDDPHERVYDVLLPGFIDAHSHGRGLPVSAHGISGDGPLERYIVELRALTPLPAGDEALLAASDGLVTGITTTQVIHHTFAPPSDYAAAARAVAGGYAAAGARAAIALTITDRDEYGPREVAELEPRRGVGPDAFAALVGDLAGEAYGDGRVTIDAIGPVGPQWCSDEALRAIARAGAARRVHCHLLETRRQATLPGDPVARLEAAGLLAARTSVAHGIWLTPPQAARFAAAGSVIVQCPGSNQRLGVGHCPVREHLAAGIPVALGLDSHAAAEPADVFAEMRAALAEAEAGGSPLDPREVLAMATVGGARALCRDDLGVLEPGAQGDVVALDLPSAVGARDPIAEIVERATRHDVAAVWVGGNRARAAEAGAARERLEAQLRADERSRRARVAEVAALAGRIDAAWERRKRALRIP
ncbi:MAG: hypothetical protein AVDCRST_MAG38-908 [uncultured Solirubrobacteraceae bacterium]|uniref:Amidohydrolase-related domain-containing protein n=1 Tax=uncultured Solirubrobacteraceae bacterium TaxID=1162706 RepID=A0A6J4RDA0_9ACTN|nr:MAG: hypothetical protein AVDCRST_MAG38-908 [uncultured Solirubrobacteraceae bacterium]